MTEPTRRNPPFSPYCAFVVQFGEATELEAGHMVGRVEHVASGQAMHFESLDALLTFLARVLRDVQRAPPPDSHE
jgi:hypothetical protein